MYTEPMKPSAEDLEAGIAAAFGRRVLSDLALDDDTLEEIRAIAFAADRGEAFAAETRARAAFARSRQTD